MAKGEHEAEDDGDPTEETLSVELDAGGDVSLTLTGIMLTALRPRERRLVCRLVDTMEKLMGETLGEEEEPPR